MTATARAGDDSPGTSRRLRELLLEEGAGEAVSVALIGHRAVALLAPTGDEDGICRQHFDSLAACARAAPEARRVDTALYTPETLEGLERALGLACRLFPARLWLFAETSPLPASERLFAFGFRRLACFGDSEEGHGAVLYEYRLRDYKQPPAWLNARFWANPARFELDEVPSPFEDEDQDDADDERR